MSRESNAMKSVSFVSLFVSGIVLPSALLCALGCQSSGYRKSETASRSLQLAAADVQAERRQMDLAMQALNDLIQKPAADLRPQFLRFSGAVDQLVACAERADQSHRDAARKNAAYFETWDEQAAKIHYGVIRSQSTTRRAEVTNRVHAVNAFYGDSQEVVWLVINYFRDIRTALSLDLTSAGLESVKSIVANADDNATKLQTSLGELADALSTSSTGMSSSSTAMGRPPTATGQSGGQGTSQ